MLSAQHEVERLLDQIRVATVDNPVIERATDRISVLCRSYMETSALKGVPPGIDHRKFSPGEIAMLELLYMRRGRCCSKAALIDVAPRQDTAIDPCEKGADVRICSIRKKLKDTPYEGMIETVWGRGFMMKPLV